MAALLGERGGQDVAVKGKTQQPREGPTRGAPRDLVWAAASAVALVVCATGLFVAGFFAHDWVNDDGGGGTEAVVVPSGETPSAQPTALATPTPLPVVQVSTDDAPAWGPADAKVTILEFSDYQ